MDQNTGYVKAIVGGRGKKSCKPFSKQRQTDLNPSAGFSLLRYYLLMHRAIDTMGYTLSTTPLLMSHIDMQMVVQLITGTAVIVEQ